MTDEPWLPLSPDDEEEIFLTVRATLTGCEALGTRDLETTTTFRLVGHIVDGDVFLGVVSRQMNHRRTRFLNEADIANVFGQEMVEEIKDLIAEKILAKR